MSKCKDCINYRRNYGAARQDVATAVRALNRNPGSESLKARAVAAKEKLSVLRTEAARHALAHEAGSTT